MRHGILSYLYRPICTRAVPKGPISKYLDTRIDSDFWAMLSFVLLYRILIERKALLHIDPGPPPLLFFPTTIKFEPKNPLIIRVPNTALLTSGRHNSLRCVALLGALHGRESPLGLDRTLDQQVRWVDDPNYIEKHVVSPEIIGFWPRVLGSLTKEFQSARTEVQDVAVDLT